MSGISVSFGGVAALSDVSLTVEPGQVHGLIGPNGAGKTTLFNVACGLVRPSAGRIVWRDQELRRLRPSQLTKLGISRTLQGVGLFPLMTVLENVMIGAHRHARAGFFSALLALPTSDADEKRLREPGRDLWPERLHSITSSWRAAYSTTRTCDHCAVSPL